MPPFPHPPPPQHTESHAHRVTHGTIFQGHRYFFTRLWEEGKDDTPSHFTPYIPLQDSLWVFAVNWWSVRWPTRSTDSAQVPGRFSSESWSSRNSGLTRTASEIACHDALQPAGTRKQPPTGFKRFHEPKKSINPGITQLSIQDLSPDPKQLPHSIPFVIMKTV